MSNSIAPQNNQVVTYNSNMPLDLVEVRMHPERFPHIDKTEHSIAVVRMKEIVIAAYLYRGQQADEDMVDFIAETLLGELLDPTNGFGTQHLSWVEVGRAVKKGVLGQGKSEMFGISVASLYACIVEYVKGEGHQASLEASRRFSAQRRDVHAAIAEHFGKEILAIGETFKNNAKEAYK